MELRNKKVSLAVGIVLAAGIALTGCAGGSSPAGGGEAPVIDAASLNPAGIVGKGRNGETPASVDSLKLTDAEKDKVRAGKFKIGVAMMSMDLDWSRLQVQGITKMADELGMEIVGVTDGQFKVAKQISDIENLITLKPDVIFSLPVDDVATTEAYKKVSAAGIKLVFIHTPALGLQYPGDYQSVVGPDNQGNGEIAAAALSKYIPQDGVAGVVDFGVTAFSQNERTKRVNAWFEENRPDVTIKTVTFTDTNNVGSVAANFVTANPDVKGLYVVWDSPAMQAVSSLRSAGVTIPITTIDLGTENAVELASGGYIKAIGAQTPYEQGVAEVQAAAGILIGKQVPAWITLPALAVTPGNVLTAYKQVFQADPPKELLAACDASKLCK